MHVFKLYIPKSIREVYSLFNILNTMCVLSASQRGTLLFNTNSYNHIIV